MITLEEIINFIKTSLKRSSYKNFIVMRNLLIIGVIQSDLGNN
jgi:hypothetical protein